MCESISVIEWGNSKLLAPIVRERQRLLVPATLVSIIFYTVAAGPMGIALPAQVYAFDIAIIVVLSAITVPVMTRRIPDRWSHVVTTFVWWALVIATLQTEYFSHNPVYVLLLIVEAATAGLLLHTGHVVVSLVLATVLAIPLILRDTGANAAISTAALVTSGLFAVLTHFLMRGPLVRAETLRLAEAETARKLAGQLTELERSQAERDKLHDQLLHAQRMEAVGTLAAGIAHDMNNVLGAITSFAGVLRSEIQEPRACEDLDQIVTEAERGAGLTRGLLTFSRRGQYRKLVIRIESVIRDVLPLLERTLPKSIAIHEVLDIADVRVEGDPVHLTQALVNFGLNAADAMNGSGTLVLSAAVDAIAAGNPLSLASGRYVRISVTDSGIGLDAATRLRVFEPFFTTKPIGRGTGLGLSTVWGIARAHNGAVDVQSELGHGATFSLYLPTTDAPLTMAKPRPPSQPIAHSGTMLVVDDEPAVRKGTKRILEKMGFDVLAAADGAEALRMFDERRGAIDLVVLDMGMPVMSGPECFAALRKHSRVPILIATGYAVDAEAQALVAAGAGIIEKPFRSEDLEREVMRILRK
jgi:two-component system cell cycle sensor histidine kinase/response regulator CckA